MPATPAQVSGSRDGVSLAKAQWKLMGHDEEGHTYGWQVEVLSKRKKDCEVHLRVHYLDEEGFELDSEGASAYLAASDTVTLTGRSSPLERAASGVRITLDFVGEE